MNYDKYLNDPIGMNQAIIEEYERQLDGEEITTSSNAFVFLTEAISTISTDLTKSIDNKLIIANAKRATTIDELFDHITDYDSVGFYSSPATLPFTIAFSKSYITENAVTAGDDTNYNKLVIPRETTFTIAGINFGLYYPIEIRISKNVDNINVVYDTTETSNLTSLNSNVIPSITHTLSGVELLAFQIDLTQFKIISNTVAVNTDKGFYQKFSYDNKFYAIRVIDVTNNKELALTMSDKNYDIDVPTAVYRVYPDDHTVLVDIPQIYFNNGKLSNRIKVEIYDTRGEVDISLANINTKDITADFRLGITTTEAKYCTPLKRISSFIFNPESTKIKGGTNGMTFEDIKSQTIYGTGNTLPVTNIQLSNYFSKKGYISELVLDNLTNRKYYAYKRLTDTSGTLGDIGVTNAYVNFSNKSSDEFGRIITHSDLHTVILPTNIYKYRHENNSVISLDSSTTDIINSSTNAEKVKLFNEELYLTCPLTTSIHIDDDAPSVVLYDLFDNEVNELTFVRENSSIAAQMPIMNMSITHLESGTGGYRIRLGFKKSDDLKDLPYNDVRVIVQLPTIFNTTISLEATYYREYGELTVYDVVVDTNYVLNEATIDIKNVISDSGNVDSKINLKGIMSVYSVVRADSFPLGTQDNVMLNQMVNMTSDYLVISKQNFTYKLGRSLDETVDTDLLVTWGSRSYLTYDYDELDTYKSNVYKKTDGVLDITIVDGKPVLEIEHAVGDTKLDIDGNPKYLKQAGVTYVRDANGDRVYSTDREVVYRFSLPLFDIKHSLDSTFTSQLSDILNDNVDPVNIIGDNLYGNTSVYFRPINTLGSSTFNLSNSSSIYTDVSFSFNFKLYMATTVVDDDNLTTAIRNKVVSIIKTHLDNKVISVAEIAKDIKSSMSEYISSVDGIGINGSDIKTLFVVNNDSAPKLATKLILDDDGEISTEYDVTLTYADIDI